MATGNGQAPRRKWFPFNRNSTQNGDQGGTDALATWNMGMLNDKETIAVPGTVSLSLHPSFKLATIIKLHCRFRVASC